MATAFSDSEIDGRVEEAIGRRGALRKLEKREVRATSNAKG
jgi:hypothetical protein